jgi:hypothetical protein
MCEPLARWPQAFDAHNTSAETMVRVPLLPATRAGWCFRRRGLRWRRGRRRLRRLWRPRKQWCRRRRPVVSKRLLRPRPPCRRPAQPTASVHISTAELAGCCRARLDAAPAAFLQPAGTEPPVACRFGHSSLRDLRVLKEGRVSGRLLCGRFGPGQGCWGGGSRP